MIDPTPGNHWAGTASKRALPRVLQTTIAALLLAGCGGGNAPGRGDVSASEARQLDQAARDTDINASLGNGTDAVQ